MKKFLSILFAGFIGFLGIFTTNSTTKNTAEPQYFLQNERKNAAVYENNSLNVYFDNNIISYDNLADLFIGTLSETSSLYYFDMNNEKVFNRDLSEFADGKLGFNSSSHSNGFYVSDPENKFIGRFSNNGTTIKYIKDIWYIINNDFSIIEIKGFCIEGIILNNNLNNINNSLNPYIGSLTSLNPETNENTTIEQIGNIISNTTNWFVNIFIGLSDIFYSNGTLGVWGSVLFLGVAFTLITMCLKWVISLIRGI